MTTKIERRHILVSGIVQGVGFRPFVYHLAHAIKLSGTVKNNGGIVSIEIQGNLSQILSFCERLQSELKTPGKIEHLNISAIPICDKETTFKIIASENVASGTISLAPDGALCSDCRKEMYDQSNRRYLHPFISCTQCGPRYSITTAMPYDREHTTLNQFPMCTKCKREYENPGDRRYHAQAISCPKCGPQTWLINKGEDTNPPINRDVNGVAAIIAARKLLLADKIVAIKGIGGFHLAVNARSINAIQRLRKAKYRLRKPFAVMVHTIKVACSLVTLSVAAKKILTSYAAPIVLAPLCKATPYTELIAPGLGDLGIFLPYTGTHELLFNDDLDAIVLTSGNRSSEPMITDNQEAVANLPADAFLLHDREIYLACDDSVVRTMNNKTHSLSENIGIRRSRGYVPVSISTPFLPAKKILALGSEIKATVAILNQGMLTVGRHLGDLDNSRTLKAYFDEIMRTLAFYNFSPDIIAVDLHPEGSGRLAATKLFANIPIVEVQHHHAHMAAVLCEHAIALNKNVCGIMIDGLGYGYDGTIWGGEILVGDYSTVKRHAYLRPIAQPGGDQATIEPMRMATSLLYDADLGRIGMLGFVENFAAIAQMREFSPLTSSVGRLFDGVAAILGIAPERIDYEGEAAARLETIADSAVNDAYPLPLINNMLDTRALITALVKDKASISIRAARFHNGLADGLTFAALSSNQSIVALGGGSIVNRLLTRRIVGNLLHAGVRVLQPIQFPAGDGAIAVGQVACAACNL
ncbi:MAG: carbamoyltransferase HypF [Deltaproteobacteria bacterium]|nr:carbamoyltransferase HypF [Deltaproteobacteria bacterium]